MSTKQLKDEPLVPVKFHLDLREPSGLDVVDLIHDPRLISPGYRFNEWHLDAEFYIQAHDRVLEAHFSMLPREPVRLRPPTPYELEYLRALGLDV